ncbi:hypothetical protein [Arthrobacter sp. SO5]|uniref:hypothetical protein n=1 Tax=Arthrobacter sp. SO5 TaxID=1897055 RepID=UPI001E3981F4|nr:hypothetical protein [Arthrobacter sp. SO5]
MNTNNKRVIGYLAEELWTTFAELNAAMEQRMVEINEQMRRADGTTRYERFLAEEAGPLPAERFDTAAWKQLKLTELPRHCRSPALLGALTADRADSAGAPDQGHGQHVDGETFVCEHPRNAGRKGQYSTRAEHAPKQRQDIDGLVTAVVRAPGKEFRAGEHCGD